MDDSDSESKPTIRSRRSQLQSQSRQEEDGAASSQDQLDSDQEQDQDDDEDEDEGEDEDPDESLRKRKKVRRSRAGDDEDQDDEGNANGNANENGNGEEDDVDRTLNLVQEASMAERAARMQSQRSGDGYLPGSIRRITLENFVTYSHTSFTPGPHLNMIIGPNGTGKSTVVCAIALGLGFPTKILGRAKDPASFVKKGTDEGFIEIELQGRPGGENLKIKRVLSSSDNRAEWYLDGKKETSTKVQSARDALDIKVDNLCSFLPQDKVADFARMTPPDLLKETEKAAGERDLISWHEQLTDLGNDLKLSNTKLESEISECANLEERNQVLERDVRRYEERQRIENKIKVLNLRIPYSEYHEAKKEYDESKLGNKNARDHLNSLRSSNEPIEEELERMREHDDKLLGRKDESAKVVKEIEKDLKKSLDTIEKIEAKAEDLFNQRNGFKKREAEKQRRIENLENAVENLRHKVDNEPERIDTSAIERRIKDTNIEGREVTRKLDDLIADDEENTAAGTAAFQSRNDIQNRLNNLTDVRSNREQFLKNERDTLKAIYWLRENKNMFEGKICEPVIFEVSPKDPKYARMVENSLNWAILKTFVAENQPDYDLFFREMGKIGCKVNCVEQSGTAGIDSFQHPMPVQNLKQLGMDDYVSNLITCPEPVMKYLLIKANLHKIPVALDERRVDAARVERSNFHRYIVGTTISTTSTSSYGNKAPQTTTRETKNFGTFNHSVDPTLKDKLEKQMLENVTEVREREAKNGQIKKEMEKWQKKKDALKQERTSLDAQKAAATKARAHWERAKIDLAAKENELQKERNRPSAKDEEQKTDRMLEKCSALRLKTVGECKIKLKNQLKARFDLDSWSLQALQHSVTIRYVEGLSADFKKTLKSAEKEAKEANERYKFCKTRATTLHNKAQALLEQSDPEVVNVVQNLAEEEMERTVDSLKAELEGEKASLEIAQGVNPAVIEQYKERLERLSSLKASIDDKEKKKADLEHKIKRLENKWIPSLEALVTRVSHKFSASFESLGCAGEVRISRDEDYAKWGIDILVKFRETEALTLLTGTRQSGGERSLSTIMYLMSLLQLAVSPFSVVDEINQGMDQRAERAVHDQMVQVTCRPEASQYFLITPKLLSNLSYHERMKVLVINNGAWLPESRRLDFKGYAKAAIARKRGIAA